MQPSGVYYPPPGFYFRVEIHDLPAVAAPTAAGGTGVASGEDDAAFQDASGLSVEMAPEEIPEGGQNGFRHRVPTVPKYADLVLKRGYVYRALPLFKWCEATLQGGLAERIKPKTLTLKLLNPRTSPVEQGEILRQWTFLQAWPTKWELSEFGATKNDVLIETLQFAHRGFTAG